MLSLFTGNATLALLAALTWGGGDFSGGTAVKRAGGTLPAALRVVLLSHAASLAALLLLLALRHDPVPTRAPLLWGLAAGLFGGTSVLCFYVCLARGAMGAPAAISGLLAAAIPSLASSLLEGAPGPLHLLGFLLAAIAIWLIAAGVSSSPPSTSSSSSLGEAVTSGEAESGRNFAVHPPLPSTTPTLALSIAAGAGFGLYFVALRMASPGGVLWPLALSRCLSVAVCLLGLLALATTAHPVRPTKIPWLPRSAVTWALATALLDTAGNLFFIAATRAGRLDVAAVLASLYPASTILLAAWLLRERPGRQQAVGMALALAAVFLITL